MLCFASFWEIYLQIYKLVQPNVEPILFDNIKDRLDQPIFAAALKYEGSGTYDFGYIDKNKYEGEITYMGVDSSDGFWSVTFDGYEAGDVQTKTSIKGIIGMLMRFFI